MLRPLSALVEYARPQAHDPNELERLEADVERYLAFTRAGKRSEPDDAWLHEARQRLPVELYEQVRLAATRDTEPVESFRGVHFDEDEEG